MAIGWWTSGFFTLDGWKHLVLPAITLCLFQMTLIMRLVRSEMLDAHRLHPRARGLSDRAVHFGHALRERVPVITIAGLQLGAIIAFAIITKTLLSSGPAWGCCSSRPCRRRSMRSWRPTSA